MNTQNKVNANFENLTEGQIKQLALMQHLGEDYFFCPDGIAYVGNLEETKEAFNSEIGSMENEASENDDFNIYCSNNLNEVEDFDNDDYLVLTDDEADDAREESLDSYLENCIYPELSGNLKNYFDDDKWKQDARYDGRGHSLASYDGNENEENVNGATYYIYRIN